MQEFQKKNRAKVDPFEEGEMINYERWVILIFLLHAAFKRRKMEDFRKVAWETDWKNF